MAKPNIKVNLSEKTISTDGRSLRLEDNFEGAGIFKILNSKNEITSEIALELSYRKNKEFHENYERNRVYDFFRTFRNDELKKLEVCSTDKKDFYFDVFPAVSINGDFDATISNR